jgi:ankyrin repeat protein
MIRKLTAQSSLGNLRKEAKRWLHALRANDAEAHQRLRAAWPGAPAQPVLREVQHALAREFGLENWVAFETALADIALESQSREKLIDEFLVHSCIHYGTRPGTGKWDRTYFDDPLRWKYAARILEKHPDIASHSIHTAAVSGNIEALERFLAIRSELADERGGPQAWQPLQYVCYGRLPTPAAAENAVAIASRLLDAGANVSMGLNAQDASLFRPLTGAIGQGEMSQPSHPQAEALADLLIERGADPYDPQALYNISLEGDDVSWLDFLYARSARRNETGKWTAPSSTWPNDGMLNYLLGNAVTRNAVHRARWLLTRGADPGTKHFYTKRNVHTEAVLLGYTEMAALLLSFGDVAEELQGHDAFHAACMRLDRETASALARQHPEYLTIAAPLLHVASFDRVDIATLLLDLGVSPDVRDETNFRPLHAAAGADAVNVAKLLIDRGAEIDPVETRFDGVPLGWALHGNRTRMIETLGALSRSPAALANAGNVARLRELLAAEPGLARVTSKYGSLFAYLPDEEDLALEVAELLLAHGTDPAVKNNDGLTAIELLERRGLDEVAELLRVRSPQSPGG